MRKYNSSDYVKSWFNKQGILNAITIILGIIIVIYLITSLDELYHEDDKTLCYFLIAAFSLCVISAFFQNSKYATMQTNLLKNYLEINEKYISGIYTDTPKISDSDKYFKIEINQIEKMEIKEPGYFNCLMGDFYNFYIYHSSGLIKLAIESPEQAQTFILGHSKGNVNQPYACACGNYVYFGQERCEKCGRKFDWTKL